MGEKAGVGIAYVPIIHKGYINYFRELEDRGVEQLYIVPDLILESHDELDYINRKDRIRAVSQDLIASVLNSVLDLNVQLLTEDAIKEIQDGRITIVTPKEDIGRFIVEHYFPNNDVTFSNVFLRRNEENVKEDKLPEATSAVTLTEFQKRVFKDVLLEAEQSADWWRKIGAALVVDREVVALAHNEHLPEEQRPNVEGDARSLFKKGIHINYVTTAHAEAALIAGAAKEGIKTEGAELYMTDFPCPYCAAMIAKSGIKRIYFANGYAVLDGDDLLKAAGVELVKVDI